MKRGKILSMKKLEQKLLPIARKWAGNIPVWAAREAGVEASTLRHWAKDNPDVETEPEAYTSGIRTMTKSIGTYAKPPDISRKQGKTHSSGGQAYWSSWN